MSESSATKKGQETRERILATALDLFRERGYDQTTMRAIADQAGVAVGSAYYYFPSKEHLIQGFYLQNHQQEQAVIPDRLEGVTSFKDRLRVVMETKFEVVEPYHAFAGVLFSTAANPESPLNPFGQDSRAVRLQSTRLFQLVVDGSKSRIPKDLKRYLPDLLWTYDMGVVMYWIHDKSPGRAKTQRLIERTVALIDQLVRLAGNPAARGLRKKMISMLDTLELPLVQQQAADAEEAPEDA